MKHCNPLIESLISTELERFTVNDYRGKTCAPEFELVAGTIPVLVSAPHAVTHLRDGRIKPSDDYTGAMALCIGKLTGAHVIVATRTGSGDPNWDPLEACAYKRALVNYVRDKGIRLALDLHGMPAASSDAIELGSADGATVRACPGLDECAAELLRTELAPYLKIYHKNVSLNGAHAARGESTITCTIARECGIAALQAEINTLFRVPSSKGTHVPEGEPVPFSRTQLSPEIIARSKPDPACVGATIRALATLVETLVD